MKTISKEYSTLFNLISDLSDELIKVNDELYQVVRRLKDAQQYTEEMFIEEDD